MRKIILNPGQLQPLILTDHVCSFPRGESSKNINQYDLSVTIMETTVDEHGRNKLNGKVQTQCAVCGHVHEAVRQYCEIEFSNNPCPRGHKLWNACVTHMKRYAENGGVSYDDVTYEFIVELLCTDCNKKYRRLTESIVGTLGSIKRIMIGLKGIEIERT